MIHSRTIPVQIVLLCTLLLSTSFAARIPNRRTNREGLYGNIDTKSPSKKYTTNHRSESSETKRISLLTPYGPIHVSLLTKNAPRTTTALINAAALRSSRCSKCQFYRAEARPKRRDGAGPPYGLLQGSFGKSIPLPTKKEGTRRIVAGDVVVIPPTGEFYIALVDHGEWSKAHTVVGMVDDFVSTDLIGVQAVKTVVHPEFGTEMQIMKSPVSFTLSDDITELVMPAFKDGYDAMAEEENVDDSIEDDNDQEYSPSQDQEEEEESINEEQDDDESEDSQGLDEEAEDEEEQQYGVFQQQDDEDGAELEDGLDDEILLEDEQDTLDDAEQEEEIDDDTLLDDLQGILDKAEQEDENDAVASFTRYEKPKRPSKKSSRGKAVYRPSPVPSKKSFGSKRYPPRKHTFLDDEEEETPRRTSHHSKIKTHRKAGLKEVAFEDTPREFERVDIRELPSW